MSDADSPQRIAIAVVEHNGSYLIRQRPSGGPLAGFWEFPGGKVHAGEIPEAAALRECAEETGLSVRAIELLAEVDHKYEHGALRLSFFRCTPQASSIEPEGGFCWIEGSTLGDYAFPPANDQVLRRILSGDLP